MSQLLKSGKVGLTNLKTLAEQRTAIVKNWDASGLLEGLNGPKKSNVAQLLENQAAAMLNEVTLDASAGRFDTVAFPIVRRVFSRLLANDLVSVQPLALPSGLLFYMDARVSWNGEDNTLTNSLTRAQELSRVQRVHPANSANGQTGPVFADSSAYERFYNNRGFDLSFGTGETAIGTSKTFSADSVTSGLYSPTAFSLGAGFSVSKGQSSATLRFSSSTAVYYSAGSQNVLVVAAGGSIPFFNKQQSWGLDQFHNNTVNVVLDLRPAGIYGADFNPAMLNNGSGSF